MPMTRTIQWNVTPTSGDRDAERQQQRLDEPPGRWISSPAGGTGAVERAHAT